MLLQKIKKLNIVHIHHEILSKTTKTNIRTIFSSKKIQHPHYDQSHPITISPSHNITQIPPSQPQQRSPNQTIQVTHKHDTTKRLNMGRSTASPPRNQSKPSHTKQTKQTSQRSRLYTASGHKQRSVRIGIERRSHRIAEKRSRSRGVSKEGEIVEVGFPQLLSGGGVQRRRKAIGEPSLYSTRTFTM